MTLRFNEDGTFRVLQMADIQDKPEVNRDTIRLIKAAIREAKPDLVVLTGDQIRGYDPAYIDTFLRRRGEKPGARVRLITEVEARIYGVKRRYPEAAELAERMADRLRFDREWSYFDEARRRWRYLRLFRRIPWFRRNLNNRIVRLRFG